MTMNSRVKSLRKQLQLNQTEFGQKIGLKNGAISWMEKDGNTIIDQNIKLICSELNVNENWLRTGEGDMFNPPPTDDVLALMQDKMNLTSQEIEIVRVFLELTPEQRQQGIQFVKDFSAKLLKMEAMNIPAVLPGNSAQDAAPMQQTTASRCENAAKTQQAPHGHVSDADTSPAITGSAAQLANRHARPAGISDQEWELVQEMRREKGTSAALDSTAGERA